jgi:hypothetical protein
MGNCLPDGKRMAGANGKRILLLFICLSAFFAFLGFLGLKNPCVSKIIPV